MKKLLIAMLVGLLLIGAASAGGNNNNNNNNNHKDPVIGVAFSNANALAAGIAYVDKDVVADGADSLTISTASETGTWQINDAKVDPISASYSIGVATSDITGDIKVGHNDNVYVEASAASLSTAFNAAEGSQIATGSTDTFNIADTSVTEHSLESTSLAGSSSTGFAAGETGQGSITDLTSISPKLPTI
jgi:hypothetical protein